MLYANDSRSNDNRESGPCKHSRGIRGSIIEIAAPVGNEELRKFQANANQFVCDDAGYSDAELQSNCRYKREDSISTEMQDLVTHIHARQ